MISRFLAINSESVATNVLGEIFKAFLNTLCIRLSPFISIKGLFLRRVEPMREGIMTVSYTHLRAHET